MLWIWTRPSAIPLEELVEDFETQLLGALLVANWRARRDYPERVSPAPA